MKYAALISFTESEKSGRYFNYTNYKNIYVTCDSDETPNQIYVPCVGKNKRAFKVVAEIIQKTKYATKEQLEKKAERLQKQREIERNKAIREAKRLGAYITKFERKRKRELLDRLSQEIVNLSRKEIKQRLDERYYMIKSFDFEKIKELIKWDVCKKSPYSDSFYNSDDISWYYKPENSLRLSDHWNFISGGDVHCQLEETTEYVNKWLLCQYRNGKYHIIVEY